MKKRSDLLRKALSVLLSMALTVGVLPLGALATEPEDTGGEIPPMESETVPQADSTQEDIQNPQGDIQGPQDALPDEPEVALQEDGTQNTQDPQYVLMNIPYGEFYAAVGATDNATDYDTISSATNKVGNYGKSGGAFHSGVTANADGDTVTAVGGANGAKNEGVIWPVKVSESVTLSDLGGTSVASGVTKTVATVGRGQTNVSYLYGYECLMEASAYSYYTLDSEPDYYLELTSVSNGNPKLSIGESTAQEKTGATVAASYGTNWGDVQLKVADVTDVSNKLVNAVVITAEDGSQTTVKAGLVHLYNVWSETDIAWKAATVHGLDGKSIKSITYYCSDKDGTVTEGNRDAPAYKNYIYQYNVTDLAIPPVYTSEVTAKFDSNNQISITGLPTDIENPVAKVYHNAGGRPAVITYLTPLKVDSADQDIDPVNEPIQNGKIAISPTLVTVTNNKEESKTYGQPIDGTEYTIEISSDNYIINKITATFTTNNDDDEDTYILMNIPYGKFYAAENNGSGTAANVDTWTSATKSKPLNGGLAGGSYHVNDDGTDITGVIYPVKVDDLSVLENKNYKQVTDDDSFSITVNNRGQEVTTEYQGKETLFQNPSYSYYVLTEAPKSYKELTVSNDGEFSFGPASGEATTATGAASTLSTGGHHAYYAINMEGVNDTIPEISNGIAAATLHTTDGNTYGLRHVVEIWRGGIELGFDDDTFDGIQGQTINKITYYLRDGAGIYTMAANLTVPVSTKNSSISVPDTLVSARIAQISANLPDDFNPAYTVAPEGPTVAGTAITWADTQKVGAYTLTATDKNNKYAPVSTTFVLTTETIYAKYDDENKKLVKVNNSITDDDFTTYLKAISNVKVDEKSYAASGRNAIVIVKEDGSLDLTTAPFTGDNAKDSYNLTVKATGYPDLTFTLTTPSGGVLADIAGSSKNGGAYISLNKVWFQDKYHNLWLDYCTTILGKSAAEDTVKALQASVNSDQYGPEYKGPNFYCNLIANAETFVFGPNNQITVKNNTGEVISEHTYHYLGTDTIGTAPIAFDCDVYITDDENAREFKYFLFREDTPETTYHIEFRYGSDLTELKKSTEGKYAYWLASGILEDADDAMVENAIALFCVENMDYSAARSPESLTQISALLGEWDLYQDNTAKHDTLYFTVDRNGRGQTYHNGTLAKTYQVYAFDNDSDSAKNSGIYITHDEEGPEWAKYAITTSGSQTILTFTGIDETGKPYTLSYSKHTSSTDQPSNPSNPSTSDNNSNSSSSGTSGSSSPSLKPLPSRNSGTTTPASPSENQPSTQPDSSFTDVPSTHWASSAIDWAKSNDYMTGTSQTTFNPEGTTNRQQLWMVLARLNGENPASMSEARTWAMNNQVSDGTNATQNMTRQQMATFLYRYCTLKGYTVSGSTATLSNFPDNDLVSDYAEDALLWAVGNGIMTGTNQGMLNPTGTTNRAQFAVILERFCQDIVNA